ncbi:hypothetical protein [Salinibacter phage M8CR30-4]|uniref:Uncharacterized protein n=2 Tax=Holosalinivirus M8CR302 TaxID=2041855 RepID=A0A2I6UGH9_9CAUD|nr:hypothetical protein FGG64_gp06 [Salinibacter phage M8CR30-2]AUO79070.1 hypothetical protein [Salinibacter phage M8CR30-2]AUO79111.1 hypothetical protein [Salinibacter phage M8CR30-4]
MISTSPIIVIWFSFQNSPNGMLKLSAPLVTAEPPVTIGVW